MKQFSLSTLALSLMAVSATHAAERVDVNSLNLNELGQISITAQGNSLSAILGLSEDNSLQVKKVIREDNGSITTRYRQLYKGLPVFGDDVIISSDRVSTTHFGHGFALNSIDNDVADVTPVLSKVRATTIAKSHARTSLVSNHVNIAGEQFAPHITGETQGYQFGGQYLYRDENAKLGIYQAENGKAYLVYKVTFIQEGDRDSVPVIYIDAKTGDVLESYDNLQSAEATGPGGNKKTGRYNYGKEYGKLIVRKSGNNCLMDNDNVVTVDMNHSKSGGSTHSFGCFENTYKEINGAYSPLNDGHYFGGVVFDMYSDWLNTAPLTFKLKVRVHYGKNYENATWNGREMSFGDGASRFYPLVSLDVMAHEVSHGFTQQNSNLVYKGQSGGLNESFSDMAGEAAEFYMTGSTDFKTGGSIMKRGDALRNLEDQSVDGRSIIHVKDFYNGIDVHHSSGVYNRVYALLSQKAGWDAKKSFLMFAKANQKYWTRNTNFQQAGNGTLDAACDLGYNIEDVKSVLKSVGVNANVSAGRTCGDNNPPPTGNELENKKAVKISAKKGAQSKVYKFVVPEGSKNISLSISGGSGDADMYVKEGSKPTETSSHCRPYKNGNNETCTLYTAGTYYVMAIAYKTFSDVSLVGSYDKDGDDNPPTGDIDKVWENITISAGKWEEKVIDIPAGYKSLVVKTSGGSGDGDLYVRQGAKPTRSSFDCRPFKGGNSETCEITNPKAGKWYVSVRGYRAVSNMKITLSAKK